ncbi:MAG: hypothetical protein Q7S74_06475 [Nanoarchaeota archaeon]|nr:hypothetical protein [Nanoarchaeota archaeon]
MAYCKICGKPNCKTHTALLGKAVSIDRFSGSSPPEVFVGRWNYPNVYVGILSPQEHGDTAIMSSPELWHKKRLPIPNILSLRKKLIYARTKSNVKKAPLQTKFLSTMQEIAMTHKSISAEYKLQKPITQHLERDSRVPLISQAALIKDVRLEENPTIKPKVEYLVNDTDVKSKTALLELERSGIDTSSMIKLLSAGLLGIKKNRILVPTRWSITAVDDTISKEKLLRIRLYQEIPEISIFTAEYLGNHYEFLLLPDKYSFEVIEIALTSESPCVIFGLSDARSVPRTEVRGLSNTSTSEGIWHDYESFFPRKKYADSVTGAYYANRLALTEYLERIKRQASCIVFREIRPEYYAPLGVGILRQISRQAFNNKPKTFNTLNEAFEDIQSRIKTSLQKFTSNSIILRDYGKQTRIQQFL